MKGAARMRPTTLALTSLLALAAPATAHAQARRWMLRTELGAGTMLRDFDHDGLSAETPALTATSRVGLRVVGPLSAEVGFTYGQLFREHRALTLAAFTAGVRVAPDLTALGRPWADLHGGVYLPGTVARGGLDVGAGFEFRVGEHLAVGPFARFTQVWQGRAGVGQFYIPYERPATAESESLQWWVLGVSLTVSMPPKHPVAATHRPDDRSDR